MEMDKLQAKLIKRALGFTKYYRTTPLLNSTNVNRIANLRNIYTVDLLKSLFLADIKQYNFTAVWWIVVTFLKKDNLMSKAHTVCFSENVFFILYLLNDNYHDMNRKRITIVYTHGNDGLTDTVCQLYKALHYDREMLTLLLLPFWHKYKLYVFSIYEA